MFSRFVCDSLQLIQDRSPFAPRTEEYQMKNRVHSKADSIIHARFSSSTQMFGLLLAIGAALGFSIKAIFVKLVHQPHYLDDCSGSRRR